MGKCKKVDQICVKHETRVKKYANHEPKLTHQFVSKKI
jgi:hypothetical protein